MREAGIIHTDGSCGSFVPHKTEILHSETAVPRGLVDLASGNVDRRLLPLTPELFDHYSLNADMGNYGDHPELMKFLKKWLAEYIGIESELMLLSSSLDIIERILMQRCISGSKVLIGDPCWPPLPALLATLRLEAVSLRMDDERAVIPEPLINDFSVVILTPRAHSPTGINYSRARWQQWQAFLNQRAALLIVDDHWAALSQQPFHGMQGFEGEWIYTTSTSKFLGTDARIAIAAGNSNILHAMKKRFTLGSRWISKILQHLTWQLWRQLEGEAMYKISENYRIRR
ncbi:aminotransferase class I/II-fold pyridoxal phosphate-dependent enzyme [Neisseria weixii]|uniref:aminotransferase class I/II-fold pyridoxal phosphate-dependent enzyme n=1 Tax=Neisseria weixii TaxID=1853276 RepID=UPI001E5E3EA3|nr:aminotransferase class I/II-fold pyridoxal phosphate-dependent enzyme [Neisseria weixii]